MRNSELSKFIKRGLITVIALVLLPAEAKVIADFQKDFNPENHEQGWSYHWNPSGVQIGSAEKYADLEGNKWCSRVDANTKHTDGSLGDGQWLVIKNDGTWSPGLGDAKSSDGLIHYAVAAYTVQPGEAGVGSIKGSRVQRINSGIGELRVYVNNELITTIVLDTNNVKSLDGLLGILKEGDTVYVAFGYRGKLKVGAFIQYTIETSPKREVITLG